MPSEILDTLTIKMDGKIIDTAEFYIDDGIYYMRLKKLKTVHMITGEEYRILRWKNVITIGRDHI